MQNLHRVYRALDMQMNKVPILSGYVKVDSLGENAKNKKKVSNK